MGSGEPLIPLAYSSAFPESGKQIIDLAVTLRSLASKVARPHRRAYLCHALQRRDRQNGSDHPVGDTVVDIPARATVAGHNVVQIVVNKPADKSVVLNLVPAKLAFTVPGNLVNGQINVNGGVLGDPWTPLGSAFYGETGQTRIAREPPWLALEISADRGLR
jgi:hypothetical protein